MSLALCGLSLPDNTGLGDQPARKPLMASLRKKNMSNGAHQGLSLAKNYGNLVLLT